MQKSGWKRGQFSHSCRGKRFSKKKRQDEQQNQLDYEDGLIVKVKRISVPISLCKEILHKIHKGHLGIATCRSRAQGSVRWPGFSRDVKSEVANCLVGLCLEHCQMNKEPPNAHGATKRTMNFSFG